MRIICLNIWSVVNKEKAAFEDFFYVLLFIFYGNFFQRSINI